MKLLNSKERKLRKFYEQAIQSVEISFMPTKGKVASTMISLNDPEVMKLICKGYISSYSMGCSTMPTCQICGEKFCDKDECLEKSLISIPIDKLP